ncbi:MAG: prepilin-type N-terminal cleavage/methylation domain-containing protein [Deltaproteobacteria bacterium]|nr:MAG: prepilin-type N-terminal cleavage/methylation domain-containing protein [Deltaproteobacteria bacterium]
MKAGGLRCRVFFWLFAIVFAILCRIPNATLISFQKMRIGLVIRKSTSSGFTLLELIVVVDGSASENCELLDGDCHENA